jgi:hypothetical protein
MSDDPRWGDDPRDRRDDDWRERDDEDALALGRGPGSTGPRDDHSEDDRPRHRDDDSRGVERDRDSRDRGRGLDPRDVFMRDLDLPRGPDREIVHDARDREYTLRGSETRTLSTVGAFRVVSARDLRDHNERPADPRSGDLRHLREEGLIRTERLPGHRDVAVVLTKEGRHVLESNRRDHSHDDRQEGQRDHRQEFYADLKKPREVEHDSQVFRAYLREAGRLGERGARIDRVVLDYELKREYQQWLHERDRDRGDADGRPDRTAHEVEEWAHDHDLPYFNDQVHFPDVRIEYQEPDGRWDHEDVEVTTVHYRGSRGAAAARSGFSCYRGSSARIGGRGGGGGRSGGGRATNPRLAEEFL